MRDENTETAEAQDDGDDDGPIELPPLRHPARPLLGSIVAVAVAVNAQADALRYVTAQAAAMDDATFGATFGQTGPGDMESPNACGSIYTAFELLHAALLEFSEKTSGRVLAMAEAEGAQP